MIHTQETELTKRQLMELRNRVMELEALLGRTRFSTRDAFENCIIIYDPVAKAFRPAASSTSIKEIVVSSTDHGDLDGLAGDDHPQYAQIAGTEGITGDWTFNRGASNPFTCVSGAGKVTYLDADKVDGFEHDQDLRQAQSPTFAGLSLNGNLATTSTLDGVDLAGLKSDFDALDAILGSITAGEANQIEAIGTVTIANDQWGYLGSLDQNLAQAQSPTFVGLNLSADLVTSSTLDGVDLAALDAIVGDVTAAEMDQVEAIGVVTISNAQWGYLGALDQNLAQAQSPTFVGLNLSADVVTASTFDGVDVSDLKADVDGFPDELKNLTAGEIGQLENIGGVTISSAQWTYLGADDQALTQASSPSFAGLTLTGSATVQTLVPAATDTYDLGSSTVLWRKGWLSELDTILFAENTVQVIGGWFWIPHGAGSLAAPMASADTEHDFGTAMTDGDFVLLRSSLQVEYIEIGAVVAGTNYNITRNLDGSGANDWVAGQAYAIMGATGDGRIELDAQTAGPTIKLLEQGATYNAQTERVRIGDMNGWGPIAAQEFGIGIGDYAGTESIYWTPTDGLVFNVGIITITSEGIEIQDDGSTARQVKWWYDDSGATRNIGYVLGDWDGAGDSVMWLSSLRGADDPWAVTQIILMSQDGVEGNDVRLSLNGTTGIASFSGITNLAVSGTVDDVDVAALKSAHDSLQSDVDGFPGELKDLTTVEIQQLELIQATTISEAQWAYLGASNQNLRTSDYAQFARVYCSDYIYALGGVNVGGQSDPGADNLWVDGYIKVAGGIRQGGYPGGLEIGTVGRLYVGNYAQILGGLHVGGVTDPGTDNLKVDGDAWIGSGLWIGSTGTVPDDNDLHIDGSINKSTALGCRVYKSSNQAIANNSFTTMLFNGELFDNDGMHSTSANTDKLYCKHAGVFLITGYAHWAANAAGVRALRILYNGSTEIGRVRGAPSSGGATTQVVTAVYNMAYNSYVTLQFYQSSGGNLNAEYQAHYGNHFSAIRIA